MNELYAKFVDVLYARDKTVAEKVAEELLMGKSEAYQSQLFHRCLKDYELSGIEFFFERNIMITPENVTLVKAQYPSYSEYKDEAYSTVHNQVIARYNTQQQKQRHAETVVSQDVEQHLSQQESSLQRMRK